MNLQNLFRKIILQSKRPHFHSPCQCFSNNTIYSSFLWLISYKKKRITISILYITYLYSVLNYFFLPFIVKHHFLWDFYLDENIVKALQNQIVHADENGGKFYGFPGCTSQKVILECIIWMYLEHFNISIFFSWSG